MTINRSSSTPANVRNEEGHWRTVAAVLALFGILATLVSPASAQESPDTITRGEYQCQKAFGRALADLGDRTGACLAECHASPGRRCSVSSPDTITADCLSRARAKANIRVLRECAGSDCPECYGADCPAYAGSYLFQTTFFVDLAISTLYCDDSFSSDGLTRAEQSCQRGLARSSGRFVEKLAGCFARCQQAVQRGSTGFSSCASTFLDTLVFDPRTQRCVDRARARLRDGCEKRCDDAPDCFPFLCPAAAQAVEFPARGLEPVTYCQDVPPPVCGDGQVTGSEVCDPSASPTGCAPGDSCLGCYACIPPCGNGMIDPGEVCDPYAYPSGCAAGLTCAGDCASCVTPPAGFCVPTSPDTCDAGLSGCGQACDSGIPGNACVSTVEDGVVCVETMCTYRTCNGSADCGPGEVCFTEGCCGPTAAAGGPAIAGKAEGALQAW